MRVLVAGHYHHVRAGSDRYHMELQQGLAEAGIDVIPFATDHPDNEPTVWAECFPKHVDVHSATPDNAARFIYSLEARRQLRALLRDARPDVAHLNIYYGQLTASILTEFARAGVPTIQTLHEYKLICPVYTCVSNGEVCERCGGTDFFNAVLRRCNRRSVARSALSMIEAYVSRFLGDARLDHYVAPSQFLADKMVEHEVVDEGAISVVPNGLDLDRFAPRGEPGTSLLYFGRLAPVKGLLTLLDAVEGLKEVELLLAGTGELEGELRRRIQARGMGNVHLLGHQDEEGIRQLINRSFATCLPAEWYENYPFTVIESMSMGRPVIATRIGGLPEMIEDGVDGMLVEPRNADQLRHAIARLARDPARSREMGRAAREKALELWALDRHVQRLVPIYERVIS